MIKRTVISQYPAYTGVGKYVHDLMLMKGFEDSVFTLYFKREDQERPHHGALYMGKLQIPYTSGWFLNSAFQSLAFKKFHSKLRELGEDEGRIYHYVDFGIKPTTPNDNSVLTIHDFFLVSKKYDKYGYKSPPFLKSNVKRYKNFHNLIADTAHVAEEAVDFGFDIKPTVVYPPAGDYIISGLDKAACRKKHNLPTDKTLIFSISSNDPRKNTRAVKETMAILSEDFKLVRVGPPIEGAYNFRNISNEDINELYNACDVFLFPTLDEGLGFPLIEAMAAGLPVVSSKINSVKEISASAALLVEPTPIELSKAIKDILINKDDFIKRGYERSKIFSIDNFQNALMKVYQRMLN